MSRELPPEYWRGLLGPCLQKLGHWELSKRELRVAKWILAHSYGDGREFVRVRDQARMAVLLRMDEAHLSMTLRKLRKGGVLQQHAEKLSDGSRCIVMTWLPNASLVAPEEIRPVAPQELEAALTEHEWLNAVAVGSEPLGPGVEQPRLSIETMDERLAREFVEGSREDLGGTPKPPRQFQQPGSAAVSYRDGDGASGRPRGANHDGTNATEGTNEYWAEQARRSIEGAERISETAIGEGPPDRGKPAGMAKMAIREGDPQGNASRERVCAPAPDVRTFTSSTLPLRDVGCAAGGNVAASPGADPDVIAAFKRVRASIGEADWEAFRGFWLRYLPQAPLQALGAVDDVADYLQRNKPTKSRGALIGARFKELCREAGRVLKLLA